jgi:folate-binding protein YgfZ
MTVAPEQTSDPFDYAAVLSRLAHRHRDSGVISLEGADRVAFLQGQLTQDVGTLATGHSRPTAGLTPKGKLLYFGSVVALPDRMLLLIPGSRRAAVAAHLSKYAVFQKVSIRDASEEFFRTALYGPLAASIAAPAGGIRLPAEGELAGEILAPAPLRAELEERLDEAGSIVVGPHTAEILRVEAGRPRFGQDADESNLPDEVGLQSAISTTKGCYVGQEIVARLRTYGRVNRRLVGFRFPKSAVPAGTAFPNPEKPDHELGRVTSAVISPRFGSIGLGFAFREIPEGAELAAAGRPDQCAVVAPLPFA